MSRAFNAGLREATIHKHAKSFNQSFECDQLKCNNLLVLQGTTGVGVNTTASNLGSTVGRVGVFDSKVGNDLQFKSLVGTGSVTLTDNSPAAGEIEINGRTETLAETLVAGNSTSGTDIVVSADDIADGTIGNLIISDPTPITIGPGLLTIPIARVEGDTGVGAATGMGAVVRGGLGGPTGGDGGPGVVIGGDADATGGDGGVVGIISGDAPAAGFASGNLAVITCAKSVVTGNTGDLFIGSGPVLGPSGRSGNIQLQPGFSFGTTGQIQLVVPISVGGLASTGVVWNNGFEYVGDTGGENGLCRLCDLPSAAGAIPGTIPVSDIKKGGVVYTGTGAPLLPVGSVMDGAYARRYTISTTIDTTPPIHLSSQWTLINTDVGAITVTSPDATHTTIGDMVVAATTSGLFLSRRDASTGSTTSPIWITYRIG